MLHVAVLISHLKWVCLLIITFTMLHISTVHYITKCKYDTKLSITCQALIHASFLVLFLLFFFFFAQILCEEWLLVKSPASFMEFIPKELIHEPRMKLPPTWSAASRSRHLSSNSSMQQRYNLSIQECMQQQQLTMLPYINWLKSQPVSGITSERKTSVLLNDDAACVLVTLSEIVRHCQKY